MKLSNAIKIFFFLFAWRVGVAINFSDFNVYQNKMTRLELEEKLDLFLKRDPGVEGYFELKEDELNVYSALPGSPEREFEYSLKLKSFLTDIPSASQKKRSELVGMRIAIDPGHFGGHFSRLEERYIDIPPTLGRDFSVQFDEGTLSYLTASYLKDLLEKEGAIVLITRSKIGEGALSIGFFDWLKENPQAWFPDTSLRKLFRRYNQLDLHARAAKINAFQPDLSIIIHYNSHEGRESSSSNNVVTPSNFNMVFIPGAFSAEELTDKESRYEFMRLLLSPDLFSSLRLARAVLQKFTENLHVPVVTTRDGTRYLETVCLKLEEGIYARNLALTRLIHGPVCYGETLVQNNADECLNLCRQDFVIEGISCSSRIKQVAEAYFEGIQNYFKNSALP